MDRIRCARFWWILYRDGFVNFLEPFEWNEIGWKNKQRWISNCAFLIDNFFSCGFESRSVVGSIYLSYIRTFSIMWMSAMHVHCSMRYHFKLIHTSTNFYCQWIESQSSISMGLTSWIFSPLFLNGIRWRIEFVSCISPIWALSHLDWISVNCNCFFIWMIHSQDPNLVPNVK